MKGIGYHIAALVLMMLFHSCTKFGKNITVTGRVLNPITGAGLEGIEVQLQKTATGLPGGFESVKEVYTDADGYFEINHLGSAKPYHLLVQSMENYYRVGWEVDNGYQENVRLSVTKGKKMNVVYHAVSYGQLKVNIQNLNCQGSGDEMNFRSRIQFESDYGSWSTLREGCYNYLSTNSSTVPAGYRYYETKVVRSGVTTYVYDTVFVNETGITFSEILY